MVDYNIGIPQQQLFQAPDPTQNFMRMQQMDQLGATARLHNMQAAKIQAEQAAAAATGAQTAVEANALSEAMKKYGDPETAARELIKQGYAAPATTALALSKDLTSSEKAKAESIDTHLGTFRTFAPSVRTPEDAGMFAGAMFEHPQLGKLMRQMGLTREQAIAKAQQDYAADPQKWITSNVSLTGDQVLKASEPKYRDLPGGGTGRVDLNNPDVLIKVGAAPAGVPSYPMRAAAAADMVQRGQRYAPELMQGAAQPVNAMAAAQPGATMQPPVSNALASPYGGLVPPVAAPQTGVVGTDELARRAEEAKLQEGVRKVGLETEARKLAEQRVTTAEETRTKEEGKKAFQESLAAILDQYKDLGKQGVLIDKGTSAGQRALTFAASQAPGLASVVSPEVGGPMQTIGNLRNTLITGLMAATGMSSKMIDSNREMQNYLDAMTSPGQTVKTISDTFNELSRKYGTGETIKPEDIAPAKSSSGIPAGRKSAAPAQVKPSERPPLSSFGG